MDADRGRAGRVRAGRRRRARRSARAAPARRRSPPPPAPPPRRRSRAWRTSAPWPAAGVIVSAGIEKEASPRARAGAARRRRARSRRARPPASRRSRVSTLPCSSSTSQVRARGEQLRAAPQARGADPGALGDLVERVRRRRSRRRPASSRGGTAAIDSPSGSSAGRSFAEWTPMSALPVEQRPLDPPHEPPLVAQLAVGGDLDQLCPAQHLGDLTRPGPGPACYRGWQFESLGGRSVRREAIPVGVERLVLFRPLSHRRLAARPRPRKS